VSAGGIVPTVAGVPRAVAFRHHLLSEQFAQFYLLGTERDFHQLTYCGKIVYGRAVAFRHHLLSEQFAQLYFDIPLVHLFLEEPGRTLL
jgi:hypothetical protein